MVCGKWSSKKPLTGPFIMKIHRFIGDFNVRLGSLKLQDRELLNQFRSVLRLKVGEKLILCYGRRNEGTAEIKEYGKDYVEVEIKEAGVNKNEPEKQVTLYCAILKRENFELVVQKATEVGVKEIVPIITKRTVKLDIRKERLEKIIKEAAEQSGRGIIPILHESIDFEKAIKGINDKNANFLFDISGKEFNSYTTNYLLHTTSWIGPEGGWTSQELETAKTADFEIVCLGKTTLRAETAAIIGSYLAIHSIQLSEI